MTPTPRNLPKRLQDGWPFMAEVRVIEADGPRTSVTPYVGRMSLKEGLLCFWPSGMSVARDPSDKVIVDQAARPEWMTPDRVMTGYKWIARLRVEIESGHPGMDDYYAQDNGGPL